LPGIVKKGSFWWRDVLKGLQNFKEMARVQVNIGVTCQFWKDKWGVEILQNRFSQAFSFAKDKQVNVRKAFNIDNVIELFNLPLSQIAFQQARRYIKRWKHVTGMNWKRMYGHTQHKAPSTELEKHT
jgi:hypothetical protein